MKGRALAASLAALLAIGCGEGTGEGTREGRSDMRIVVVSHGQSSDPFWSIVANGIDDAAEDMGVAVSSQAPTTFDMVRMNQLIDAAVVSRPDGLIVSIPDPEALGGSIREAVAAGIPTLSINSGPEDFGSLGLLAHIGQTEHESGYAAGQRLLMEGARRVLCVNHEVGNVSLDERCRGLAEAVDSAGGVSTVLAVDIADPEDARQRVAGALAQDPTVDGILALGAGGAVPTLAGLRQAGRLGEIAYGTFDLDPAILRAIEEGHMLFAIDQQPYLQGYLGVVLMVKHLETGTMPGGGQVIRTGPNFVTGKNVAQVMELSEKGIR